MIRRLISILWRQADFAIGGRDNPYLLRWYILPRNRWFNLYLHKFCRDDEDRALHNHPWGFVTFLFWGRYDEVISDDGTKAIYRNAPSVAYRPATHRHRIVLPRIIGVDPITNELTETRHTAWTIVLTGPIVQTWGFFCPKGFVPWYDFVDTSDSGNIGRGCGEHEPNK